MATMARASSGLAYPDRFYAAAAYVGFDGSADSGKAVTSKFSNDAALLLYALYQQVLPLLPRFFASIIPYIPVQLHFTLYASELLNLSVVLLIDTVI